MAAKIEVYVRNEVGLLSQGIMRPVVDHWCSDAPTGRYERVMPDKDRALLTIAEEFAKGKGLQLKVCDVCTFTGRLKAWLKGIRETPTVVIGKSRIVGGLDSEQLKKRIESCLSH